MVGTPLTLIFSVATDDAGAARELLKSIARLAEARHARFTDSPHGVRKAAQNLKRERASKFTGRFGDMVPIPQMFLTQPGGRVPTIPAVAPKPSPKASADLLRHSLSATDV